MGPTEPSGPSETDETDRLLAEYMERVDRGEHDARERLLAEHPELAGPLQEYLGACEDLGLPTSAGTPVPAPGDRVRYFGDYELLEEVGRGGMGVVFRAWQVSLNRPVALKMILTGPHASVAERERFRFESEAAAALDHPHIVPIYETGEHQGIPYYSMKLIETPDVSDDSGPPPGPSDPVEAARFVVKVAEAIQYAHERGVLHRDLKPDNVLVDERGEPQVVDFGLAKLLGRGGRLTGTGDVLGTPAYMAPEQTRGGADAATTATDVYGLGAVLYHRLTGSAPFAGPSGLDVLARVRDQPPRSPRAANPRVDRDLETVCLRCLEKDSARRYRSARELADDLARWLRGDPVQARPVGRLERVLKWARRRPAVAALGVALITSSAVGLVTAIRLGDRARREWSRAEGALGRLNTAYAALADRGRSLETALASAEAELYGQCVARADLEVRVGRVARATRFLEQARPGPARPERRGWEWRYLAQVCRGERLVYRGHTGRVWKVVYAPKGDWAASAGEDGDVRVWNPDSGLDRHVLKGHRGRVSALSAHPGGDLLASGGDDGTVRLWSTRDGRETRSWTGFGKVLAVAFTPGGDRLAAAGEGGLARVWETESGREVTNLDVPDRDSIYALGYSPDGRWLTTSGKLTGLRVWPTGGGAPRVLDRGFHRDFAYVPGKSSLVALGDTITAALPDAPAPPHGPMGGMSAAGHGGGVRPASGGDPDTVLIFADVARDSPPVALRQHQDALMTIACHPDGDWFATGGRDAVVRLWSRASGRSIRSYPGQDQDVLSLAFPPDGRSLAAAGSDGTVRVWDATADPFARVLLVPEHFPKSLALAPDGRRLASAGVQGSVVVWDATTGEVEHVCQGHRGIVHAVAFHPKANRVVSGSGGTAGELILWDAGTGAMLARVAAHGAAVQSLAFSPDGSWLVSTGVDGVTAVRDPATLQNLHDLGSTGRPSRAAAVSADGRIIATAGDTGEVRLWDTPTWKPRGSLTGHKGTVWALAFGPEGQLATAGDDRAVRVWDVAAGRPLVTLEGHAGRVRSLSYSPDGRLASGSADGAVRVWDVGRGREVLSLHDHEAYPTWVEFSRDGRRLASTSMDGTIRVRTALPPTALDATPVAP